MSEVARFIAEVQENIEGLRTDAAVRQATIDWVNAIAPHKYTYNFTWLASRSFSFRRISRRCRKSFGAPSRISLLRPVSRMAVR